MRRHAPQVAIVWRLASSRATLQRDASRASRDLHVRLELSGAELSQRRGDAVQHMSRATPSDLPRLQGLEASSRAVRARASRAACAGVSGARGSAGALHAPALAPPQPQPRGQRRLRSASAPTRAPGRAGGAGRVLCPAPGRVGGPHVAVLPSARAGYLRTCTHGPTTPTAGCFAPRSDIAGREHRAQHVSCVQVRTPAPAAMMAS